jgi:hypothetical protein
MGGGGRSSSSTATSTAISTNTNTTTGDIGLTGQNAVDFQRLVSEASIARDQINANNFTALTNTTDNIFSNLGAAYGRLGDQTAGVLGGALNAFTQTLGAASNVAGAAQNTAQASINAANRTAQTPGQIIADNLPLIAAGIAAIIGLFQLSKGKF